MSTPLNALIAALRSGQGESWLPAKNAPSQKDLHQMMAGDITLPPVQENQYRVDTMSTPMARSQWARMNGYPVSFVK